MISAQDARVKRWRMIPVGPALVLGLLVAAAWSPPAWAQARTDPLPAKTRVALADVSDGSHYKHIDMAAALKDALTTAMLDAERVEIVPDEQVQAALLQLGYGGPTDGELPDGREALRLDDVQLRRVGEAVGARIVLAARCVEARYNDYDKSASVVIRVRILDSRAGEAIRTCQVRGEGARGGRPLGERQVVENAVKEAAYTAVEELKRNLAVVGTVVVAMDENCVRVNLASARGVTVGTRMEVWEHGHKVADLVATDVSELGCICKVTSKTDPRLIQTGATVYVTEFAPEGVPPPRDGPPKEKRSSKWGTVLAVVLGLGLLYLAYREVTKSADGDGLTAGFRGIQNHAQVQSGQVVEFEVAFTNRRGQPVPDDTEVIFYLLPAASARGEGIRVRQATGAFLGAIESPKRTAGGIATTRYTAGSAGQSVQIVAQLKGFKAAIVLDIVSGAPASVTLRASETTIVANGTTTTTITATVSDSAGNPVIDGTPVVFSASQGTLMLSTVPTTAGQASTTLRSTQSAGPVTVTAAVGDVTSQPLIITFAPGSPSQVLVTATQTNLSAGTGRTRITAYVLDAYSNPVPDTTQVTFSVTPSGRGTFSAVSPTTTAGQASAIFTAGDIPGVVTITCQAVSPADQPPLPVQGTVEVNIAATTPDEIQLLVSPATAPADGATTITVRATCLRSGLPVADGTPITFELIENLGGAATIRSRDLVTKDGQALALVASSAAGTATIRASSPDGTAPPAQAVMTFTPLPANAIILSVGRNPIRIGEDNAGAPPEPGLAATTITATATDERGMRVADGTPILFSSTLGSVSPSRAETQAGAVTVRLTSLATGRAVVTAASGAATASVDILVLAGPAAAVSLVADPKAVRADGNSLSTITCTVVDASGNLVDDGTIVAFTATNRTVNGELQRVFVTPEGRTTAGSVTAILVSKLANGSTVPTPADPGSVFVQATVPGSQYTPPRPDVVNGVTEVQFVSRFVSEVRVGVAPFNLRGLDVVGNEATVQAIVYDDAHNPVPDNTAVYFSVSEGLIRGNAGQVGGVAQSFTTGGVATATLLTPGGLIGTPFDGWVDITVSVGGPPGVAPPDGVTRVFENACIFSGPAHAPFAPYDLVTGPSMVVLSKDTLYWISDSITVSVFALDENSQPVVDGTQVQFESDKGTLDATAVPTAGGVALTTLRSTRTADENPVAPGPGTLTITIPRGNGLPALRFIAPFTVISELP